MRTFRRILKLLLCLLVVALAIPLYYVAYPNLPEYDPPRELHYLDQWDDEARQTYYYTPQGTRLKGLRYDWFVALEQPFSRDRLAEPAYLARFGFLVDPEQQASARNPGNLPVGFARHTAEETGEHYLDITCSACHTGELRYQGKAVRIDGGAALHSLASTVPTLRGGSFGQALGMSMAFTYYNPLKFKRFAREVLGERYEEERDQLRRDFKAVLDRLLATAFNDWHRGLYPTEEGFGRTDAFGRIANTVFGDAIDPANYRVADAPVSYPHLWDIWKFDWVQWNGSAMQPMARNVGEALGVGATLRLFDEHGQPLPEQQRYASSVRPRDLHTLENPQAPAGTALAGGDPRPHRCRTGQPGPRTLRGELRPLSCPGAQTGRRTFRPQPRPGVADARGARRSGRHRPDHRRQHRPTPFRHPQARLDPR